MNVQKSIRVDFNLQIGETLTFEKIRQVVEDNNIPLHASLFKREGSAYFNHYYWFEWFVE